MASLNGKVSHRKLGESIAHALALLDQHANVINGQQKRLQAYGERLADLIEWQRATEQRLAKLDPPIVVRVVEETEEQPVG